LSLCSALGMKYAYSFIAGYLVRTFNSPQAMIPKGMLELDPVARARPSESIRAAVFLYLRSERAS